MVSGSRVFRALTTVVLLVVSGLPGRRGWLHHAVMKSLGGLSLGPLITLPMNLEILAAIMLRMSGML